MKATKLMAALAVLALLVCLPACAAGGATGTTSTAPNRTTAPPRTDEETADTAYPDKTAGFQMEAPQKGEQIAVLHTDCGDLYVRLFPEAAPLAVNNFIALAQKGYYNGVTFHYIKQGDIVQTGDPTGTGEGGESATGEPFADEFDTKLLNLYGSLAMASADVDSNGSQFYINQKNAEGFGKREYYTPEYREAAAKDLYNSALEQVSAEELKEKYGISDYKDFITDPYVYDWIPDEVWTAYEKHGGNVRLDGAFRREGGHTVFGQIFQGLDVLEDIANTVVDSNHKPVVKVCIKSIEITTYQG
ncbi:MAG: peptidylprolyl isomerase [Clostridia bacterium]|nr:peptidylprolyl isomerase [Clostridia bacterium]